MTSRFIFEPLSVGHAQELGAVLRNEQVYEHIGGNPPSSEDFLRGIQRAVAGPPANRAGDAWINYAVRLKQNSVVVGRLEATVHDSIAEVAFLFGHAHWGKGYATEGLLWLHELLLSRHDCSALWATTVPANHRCQSLLLRCGYHLESGVRPARLVSYDDGDLVFRGPSAAKPLL